MLFKILLLFTIGNALGKRRVRTPGTHSLFRAWNKLSPKLRQEIRAKRQALQDVQDVPIGYAGKEVATGGNGYTISFCQNICDAQKMVTAGFRMEISFINVFNPGWQENGKPYAAIQLYPENNGYNLVGNVVNFKRVNGKREFLTKVVFDFDMTKYGGQKTCVAINAYGLHGIFNFQLRWTQDPITPTTDYEVELLPIPTASGAMVQFADTFLAGNSFSVDNFQYKFVQVQFCPRQPSTGWDLKFVAMADPGLSAFSTFACMADVGQCTQDDDLYWVATDISGSSYNQIDISDTNPKVTGPNIVFGIVGFGGDPSGSNNGTFLARFG